MRESEFIKIKTPQSDLITYDMIIVKISFFLVDNFKRCFKADKTESIIWFLTDQTQTRLNLND